MSVLSRFSDTNKMKKRNNNSFEKSNDTKITIIKSYEAKLVIAVVTFVEVI